MDNEKRKEELMDSNVTVSHLNMLWLLYRILSEDIITTEELEEIGYKII